VILAALAVLVSGAAAEHRPRLLVDGSVGADLEALALETWDQFLAVFWARRDCFGDVHLRAAYTLGSRAGYDPDTATVTVRVPGTAAMLQSGLIHEWAHHVEFQCEAHQELRAAFLAVQGLPADTPWRPDEAHRRPADAYQHSLISEPASDWAEIPSEQYAEATIELVLGGRPVPTQIHVTREAIGVVGGWATGHRPLESAVETTGD
jgi:hypothetical protein